MAMTKRIPYNKKDKGSKILGGGGPRDLQRRQPDVSGTADINMPKVDINELKRVLLNDQKTRTELKDEIRSDLHDVKQDVKQVLREEVQNIDTAGGLPLEVVQQKIEDAVKHTQETEKKRYESGIGNINSQLNQAKKQVKTLTKQVVTKTNEVDKLKTLIDVLEDKLENKEAHFDQVELELKLSEKERREEVGDLRDKITELLEKMMTGELSIHGREFIDEEGKSKRPTLEDVFIDPLEELDTELDSHINIDSFDAAEAGGYKRDLKEDVAKLKNLLSKKEYKPVKNKSNILD